MIRLMKKTFYNEEEVKKKLCDFILNAERLSMGEKCLEFEKKFSEYQGRKYGVFFNSGSSANFALINALVNLEKLKKEDNVGFSAVTWATNVMPLLQLGLNPVPVDVSLKHLNVSSEEVDEVLQKTDLKAIFITNLLGFSGDLEKIKRICDERGIILLEDNCESLGSELNNKLGNYGLASTFSFFVGHHLSTIEGGMVCTDDIELYDMLKMIRAHGWDRDLSKEKQDKLRKEHKINDFYSKYSFYFPAFNLRPTEIQGFVGLEQLKYIKEMHSLRNKNLLAFDNIVKQNPNIKKLDFSHMKFVSNFAYPLVFESKELFERYKEKFEKNNVEIRPIVGGSMVEQPFFKKLIKSEFSCPNSKLVHETGFYIPNRPDLEEGEVKLICDLLKSAE